MQSAYICMYMYVCMRACPCTIDVFNKELPSRVRELGPPSLFFRLASFPHALCFLSQSYFQRNFVFLYLILTLYSFLPLFSQPLSSSGQRTKAPLDKIPLDKTPRKKAPSGQKPLPTRTKPS